MGLVEEEWIETLATLDPEDVTYLDFVSKGNELCQSLKEKVTGYTFFIIYIFKCTLSFKFSMQILWCCYGLYKL